MQLLSVCLFLIMFNFFQFSSKNIEWFRVLWDIGFQKMKPSGLEVG